MLYLYVKEFIAICDYLTSPAYGCTHKNDLLIIPKDSIEPLLNRNQYETAFNKLKTWKALHWIETEEKRLTKKIYDRHILEKFSKSENCNYIYCIVIYRSVYLALKALCS